MRVFVAVHPSEPLRVRVAALMQSLQGTRVRVKWVEPENLHFTLRFLGELTASQVDNVQAAVLQAAQGLPPPSITLEGVGAFPSLARAQVVWVGVTSGAGDLARLYQRLSQTLKAEGFAPETRPFQPHLTLGRCKEPHPDPEFRARLEAQAHAEVGRCSLQHVSVMQSVLGRQGPTYRHVLDVPLVR